MGARHIKTINKQMKTVKRSEKKYVVGTWFSSKIVFYDDGSINDTPEDRGTFNVYYGDNPFGKYVIHGIF